MWSFMVLFIILKPSKSPLSPKSWVSSLTMVMSLKPIDASFTCVDEVDHLCVWVTYVINVCGLGVLHGFYNASHQKIRVKWHEILWH